MPKSVKNAKTVEQAYNVLANLAYSLAERKLRDGTASSQLICEIMKHDTERYRLENEKLRTDIDVANAKIEQMKKAEFTGEMYKKAMEAFRKYSGQEPIEDNELYEEEEDYY